MANVKFRFTGDDSELRKKLAGLAKLQAEMSDKFEKNLKKTLAGASSNSLKGISDEAKKSTAAVKQLSDEQKNLKAAQLENIESLRRLREERSKEISDLNILKQLEQDAKTVLAEKKAATEGLTQTEKELNIQYKQGQIELQAYNKELKEQAEARRKVNAEERAAEKVLRDAERARKDAEREAEKAAKAAEKRRKQLEKENSEYYKLNTALGKVRKEARDVLAEMFRLEQAGHKTSLGYEMLRKRSEELVEQTNILDAGIKKIDAQLGIHFRNVGNYQDALENLSPAIANINQKLSMFGTSLEELSQAGGLKAFGASLVNICTSIGKFLISPVGIAVVVLTSLFMLFSKNKQTVIDFNDGLLNVSKTTGLTGSALQSFSDDIISLSRSLKTVSTDKLLEYASVAGQLGVKGSQNILAFSEALAKLETASDISGEEGASQIARLLQLVDGGVGNIKAFGDEIVQLGNNFPATESEILANATRIAQSTGIYKLGRQEILAYATATKSVGVEAELVGSTLGRTLGTLEKAIRSGKGVDEVLRLVGGTQAELGNRFREDASGVLMDFIGGLNRTSTTASDFNKSLEAVGITAQRDRDVIGSLASKGYATLADAMDQVKDATGSMDAEFGTASEKLINQSERISIAWNNFVLGIENGQGSIGKASVAVISFVADTIDAMSGNVAESDKLLDSYRKLESQTSSTEKSVRPLLSRYDELKSKTTLNKDEHTELREIIKRVSELIPSAVTEFDKYGQAIDINKKKITQFNDAQKQLVKDMNITARKTLNVELDELKRQRDQITSVQNNSLNNEKGTSFISRLARIGLSDEKRLQGIQDRTQKIAVLTDKIKNNLQKQRDLGGTLSPQDNAFMKQFDPASASTSTNSNKQDEVVKKNKEYWEKIVSETQEAIDALEVSQKGSDIWNSLSKKLAEAQKNVDKYSLSKDESAAKSAGRVAEETRKATERQRSLQLDIDKINETASRNQITRNESEVESIKDKYRKIREEVDKFYRDPKNKGLRVNTSGLVASENFEISEAEIRQSTKATETQFDAQKKLLDEYNSYAEQTSKTAADERFANELDIFKDYEKNVNDTYDRLVTKKKTADLSQYVSTIKFTQAEEEALKKLSIRKQEIADKRRQYESKELIEALKLSETYSDKILKVQEKYEKAKSALGEKVTNERKAQLDKVLRDEISAILVAQYEQEANTEKMYRRISFLSKKASLDAIADARKILIEQRNNGMSDKDFENESFKLDDAEYQINLDKSWIASTGALKKYREQVRLYGKDSDEAKKAQKEYFIALADDIAKAQAIISSLEQGLQTLGISGFEEVFRNVSGILDGAKDIASGNPIGIITGSIKLLSNAINLFNTKDKKLQKQIDAYKDQLDSLGKAYDRLQGKLSNSDTNYYDNQNLVLKNLDEQEKAVRAMMKAEDDKKKTDKDKMKAYRDQLDEIDKRREDVEKAVRQMRLQTDINSLSQSIADALLSAFEAGEDGIESMDKAFDKFIKNALVNSLRLKFINPIVEDMVNKLDQYMAKNDNSPVGFNFDDWRNKLNGVGKTFNEAMESAFAGLGLEKDGTSSNSGSLKNDIQGMTEQQAGRLEAEFGGLRIAQLQLLETTKSNHTQMYMIAQDKLSQLIAIQQNTYRTANNTDRLANIENAIVSLNNKVSSSDAARRGAGL